MSLKEKISNLFSPITPIRSGNYEYTSPADDPRNYRLHLRIEVDGSGILIVNGSMILHLNQTAVEYAYHLLKNNSPETAANEIKKRYAVNRNQAIDDYQDFIDRIQILLETPDLDPISYLNFDRRKPFTGPISAPYRLDMAVTYELPEFDSQENAPVDRVSEELNTEEWIQVIDKAWEAGIPHLAFTGGEPTLRDDLPILLLQAEKNGQITGLVTDGLRFTDDEYLNQILMTGLDYVLMVYRPEILESKASLAKLLQADIFVAVHLTLLSDNYDEIKNLILEFYRTGVKAVSISTNSADQKEALIELHHLIAELGLELVWNLAVPYSNLHPVAFEAITPLPKESSRAWMYVEPDGDVCNEQHDENVVGNMLKDPWDRIWESQVKA